MRELLLEFDTLDYGKYLIDLINRKGYTKLEGDVSYGFTSGYGLKICNNFSNLNLEVTYEVSPLYSKLIIVCNNIRYSPIYNYMTYPFEVQIHEIVKRKLDLIIKNGENFK